MCHLVPANLSDTISNSKALYSSAHLDNAPMFTWGPVSPNPLQGGKNASQNYYRRVDKDTSDVWGGNNESANLHDWSAVIGVWSQSHGWRIYAQKLRMQYSLGSGKMDTMQCAEVWKLYQGVANLNPGAGPTKM
jgi:hypothetical protein